MSITSRELRDSFKGQREDTHVTRFVFCRRSLKILLYKAAAFSLVVVLPCSNYRHFT
jgi:hypothetical protein